MQKSASQKFLHGDLLHYSYYSIEEHVLQINRYTSMLAKAYHKQGVTASYYTIIFHSFWRFFKDYIFKLGFLDGFYGLVVSMNSAHETFIKYVKLRKIIADEKELEPFRICFFNSTISWGGGEKWHFDIASRLADQGKSILLVTNRQSELFQRVKRVSLPYYRISISNLSFLNVFKIIKLVSFFRRQRIKTVIINLSADLKIAGISAKLAGVKNIIYRRGSAIPISNNLLNRYLFKHIVSCVIANSEETKRTILSNNPLLFPKKKINVIYNGIHLNGPDQFQPNLIYQHSEREIIIGNAGRLVKQKGQKYLIDMASILKKKNLNFKILIAGEGRLEQQLKQMAIEAGVENEIVFLGFVDNVKAFMETIDIFVLPSLWEGFGYVLIEAMACMKPVVAFDISSNPEIIVDNETGFLVKNMDILAFSSKVELLISNASLRERFGKEGRKRVEEIFEINQTQKRVEQLLATM